MKFLGAIFLLFSSPESRTPTDYEIPKLRILYESDKLAVVAKPALVPCHWPESRIHKKSRKLIRHPKQRVKSDHPAAAADAYSAGKDTMVPVLQRAIATFPDQPTIRLVHRLDAGTSGCLLIAFSSNVARDLQECWKEGAAKTYYAICRGDGETLRRRGGESGSFIVNGQIKDSKGILRDAETEIEGLWGSNGPPRRCCLVKAKPKTGRYHQIRQHLGRENYPLVGETKHHPDKRENRAWKEAFWDPNNMPQRLCLHCQRITISQEVLPNILPNGLDVYCPLPNDMQTIVNQTDWGGDAQFTVPELFS